MRRKRIRNYGLKPEALNAIERKYGSLLDLPAKGTKPQPSTTPDPPTDDEPWSHWDPGLVADNPPEADQPAVKIPDTSSVPEVPTSSGPSPEPGCGVHIPLEGQPQVDQSAVPKPQAPPVPEPPTDKDPWPEPVSGGHLLNEIADRTRWHVVLPVEAAVAIALWVLHTYLIDALYLSPLLAIISAVKRSAKTTLLELIQALVPRPLLASNLTPAAIFHHVDTYAPTLLVDEADTFLAKNSDIRGIVNGSYLRSSAFVMRAKKKYKTFCPKAIASIGSLPDTLMDRAIAIKMRRRAPSEHVEPIRRDTLLDDLLPLRRRALRWAQDHIAELHKHPAIPEGLHDRAADNWRPLLAIADLAGGEWAPTGRSDFADFAFRRPPGMLHWSMPEG